MTSVDTLKELEEFCEALCLLTQDPFAHCRFRKRAAHTTLLIQVRWQWNGSEHGLEYAVTEADLAGAMEVDAFGILLDQIKKEMAAHKVVPASSAREDVT